jgi:hypothetical protein
MVEDMINNPSSSFGFLIMPQQNTVYYNGLVFASNDNANTAILPKLVITYTTNAMTCLELVMDSTGMDANLESQFPTGIGGNSPYLDAMTWTCNSVLCHMEGLLWFDLSFIPSTATIDSAFLKLYADANNTNTGIFGQPMYGTNNAGWVRRITQSWNENTVTWNTQPVTTTQNQAALPQSTAAVQNYIANVRDMVQDMINNPSSSFGFMLVEQNQTTWYNSLIFGSKENSNPNLAAHLKVCYTDAASIPTVNHENNLSVFPNPASNELIISGMKSAIKKIEISNVLGEMVFGKNISDGNYSCSVNISPLPPGIYFVKAVGQKEERVAKFVKQ